MMYNAHKVPLAFPQPDGPGAGEYGDEGMTLLDYHAGNIAAAMVSRTDHCQPSKNVWPLRSYIRKAWCPCKTAMTLMA